MWLQSYGVVVSCWASKLLGALVSSVTSLEFLALWFSLLFFKQGWSPLCLFLVLLSRLLVSCMRSLQVFWVRTACEGMCFVLPVWGPRKKKSHGFIQNYLTRA